MWCDCSEKKKKKGMQFNRIRRILLGPRRGNGEQFLIPFSSDNEFKIKKFKIVRNLLFLLSISFTHIIFIL